MVGRAELKLAEAAKAFGYDFRGKVVLDIGSSTGGFTEYALRQGARKVIAVEKGTRQMKAPLRYDERVDLYEKTDFFDVEGANKDDKLVVQQGEKSSELVRGVQVGTGNGEKSMREAGLGRSVGLVKVETVLADVSFVSLREILTKAKEIVVRQADYLVMLKPQFEAYPDQLLNGVVKNERMRRETVQGFERWLGQNGFVVLKKRDNETVGKRGGNREKFYWLKLANKT